MDIIELNIALIPDEKLDAKLVAASDIVASAYRTRMQLDPGQPRLSLAGHLTLYQLPLPIASYAKAGTLLRDIARRQRTIRLAATKYAYNPHEGSLEVQREMPVELVRFQAEVIAALNPLRGSLVLERDPGGNNVQTLIDNPATDETLRQDLIETGYGEHKKFRPHDTINWLEPGQEIAVASLPLPSLESLHGTYPALGIFALGPRGTCAQRLAAYLLGS